MGALPWKITALALQQYRLQSGLKCPIQAAEGRWLLAEGEISPFTSNLLSAFMDLRTGSVNAEGSNQESNLKFQMYSSPLVIITWEVAGKVSHRCWAFRSDTTGCPGFARERPQAMPVASINASNNLVHWDALRVGWTQTYSLPESHVWCGLQTVERNRCLQLPWTTWKCHIRGPWVLTSVLKSSLIPIMANSKCGQTLTLQALYPNPHVPASHGT